MVAWYLQEGGEVRGVGVEGTGEAFVVVRGMMTMWLGMWDGGGVTRIQLSLNGVLTNNTSAQV